MMIVIPMAGLSSRFLRAGYSLPKYMLELNSRPLFDYCLLSFKKYFEEESFLFVARDINNTKDFICDRCTQLGIRDYKVVILDEATNGQAETVYKGLEGIERCGEESLIVFNIDTIRPNYTFPFIGGKVDVELDGYIEVFTGDGDGWSFVRVDGSGSDLIIETAEKNRISNMCSTGLYYFKSIGMYMELYKYYSSFPVSEMQAGEYYIAPMYNKLIQDGAKIRVHAIESSEILFSGVPDEYEALRRSPALVAGV